MKKRRQFIATIGIIMKVSFIQTLLSVLATAFSLAGPVNAQELMSRKVSMQIQQQEIKKVLSDLEAMTKVKFVYSSRLLPVQRKVSLSVTNQTISEVLEKLFRPDQISYRIVNERIILSLENSEVANPESESRQSQQIIQTPVKGKVTDIKGEGLPGVSIVIKGKQNGTITDAAGAFEITVDSEDAVLIFSFIGYNTQEVKVDSRALVNLTMTESENALSEVVVVGYGTQRKSDLTGSVGSVKSVDLMQRPAINVEQSLAGRIAGVNVSTNSGRPGGRTSISIRGFSSVNASNDPLYVVDGIIWTEGITNLNPNDVESIDVLKDASSTAIYGTRGSNGVIIVTTKRGNKKGNQVRYDNYLAINKLPASRNLDVLNARQWLDLEEVVYQNAGKFDPVGYAAGKYVNPLEKRKAYLEGNTAGNRELFKLDGNGVPQPIYDVDYSKEVFRTSLSQNHNIAFTGGNKNTNYGLYLGYANDNGIIKESFQKKYNIRAVVDQQMKDWLKVGVTLSYVRKSEGGVDDSNGSYNVIRNIVEMVPFIPYKYADGAYGYGGDYAGLEKLDNPLSEVYENQLHFNSNALNGSSYAKIKLLEGLEFTSAFGANISNDVNNSFSSSRLQGDTRKNSARIASNESIFWQWSNRFNYSTIINGIHAIDALLGTEKQKFNYLSWTSATGSMPDDYYSYYNLAAGATPVAPTSGTNSYQMESYFGRINYGLKNKYLVTLTGRFDGSSRFGKNNQFAFFPSAAAAWKISEEEFLKSSRLISNLKLRTSYGLTGNSEIGSYRSLANLSTNAYIFGNSRATGSGIGRLANPDLKWEKTAQYDLGVELGLWNDRVNLEADVFYKKTNDLLLDAPIPSSSGYSTVTKNIGDMENKGIEVGLNTVNSKAEKFSWLTSFNISFLKNRVTALGANNEDIIYGFKENQILRVGYSVGSIYGYIRDGIYGTEEAEQAKVYGKLPGDVKIRDIVADGVINAKDRAIIGKGIPDFYGTLMNTFNYGGLSLLVELQYSKGNQIFNNTRNSSEGRFGIANNYATVLDSWTPENQDAVLEQLRPTGYSYFMDTRKLSDGSFIRGKNLSLSYNFPVALINKADVSNLRVFASAQNFFLLTKYFGYDPELNNYTAAFSQGITYTNYPKPKTYMFGLSLTF